MPRKLKSGTETTEKLIYSRSSNFEITKGAASVHHKGCEETIQVSMIHMMAKNVSGEGIIAVLSFDAVLVIPLPSCWGLQTFDHMAQSTDKRSSLALYLLGLRYICALV